MNIEALEQQVLLMLGSGLSIAMIANRMNLTERAIQKLFENVQRKMTAMKAAESEKL